MLEVHDAGCGQGRHTYMRRNRFPFRVCERDAAMSASCGLHHKEVVFSMVDLRKGISKQRGASRQQSAEASAKQKMGLTDCE